LEDKAGIKNPHSFIITSGPGASIVLNIHLLGRDCSKMNPDKIPFFPKQLCYAPLVDADRCTMLGITIPCMNAFGEQQMDAFGFEMLTSHWWTFILTTAIGLYNLSLVRTTAPVRCKHVVLPVSPDAPVPPVDAHDSSSSGSLGSHDHDQPAYSWSFVNSGQTMAITTGLYAILTAMFALVRYYLGVSKPLLVMAALHNLCEWFIVVMIANGSKNTHDLRLGFGRSFYWIASIICLGMHIFSFPYCCDVF
jgi:hypothetical protein